MTAVAAIGALVATTLAGSALIGGAAASAAEPRPAPVVFVLDASGSMVRDTSPGVSRMDVAKAATIQTIESLAPTTDVGLLVFGTGTGNTDAERAAGCADVTTLAPLAPLDVPALSAAIGGVVESGFTPIGPALRQAVSQLPVGEPGTIVLVSDGVDTCSPPSSCEIASQLHRENPLISINVVGFGVDDDEAAQQQMTCIGGVGGGTAVSASDPTQLAARLRAATTTSADTTSLGARGIHGVQPGMSLAEVRYAVDGAEVGEPRTEDGVVIVFVDCGWGTVELRNDRVYAIVPNDEDTPTAEGLGPGDTLDAFDAVYGAPVTADVATPDSRVYAARPGSRVGYRVTFDPDTQTVRYVVVCRCVAASALSSDLRNWEVDFDGVGPLTLGMSLTDARGFLPGLVAGWREALWTDDANGFSLEFVDDRLVRVTVQRPEGVDGGALPHARGIRLGDSGQAVENVFPGGTYRTFAVTAGSDYLAPNREGRLLTFSVDGESVYDGTFGGPFADSRLVALALEDAGYTFTEAARAELYPSF